MKFLFSIAISLIVARTYAQVECVFTGTDIPITDTTIAILDEDGYVQCSFEVKNILGEPIIVNVERIKIVDIEDTEDYLVWGARAETGLAYPPSELTPNNPWISPHFVSLEVGVNGYVGSFYISHGNNGCVKYRYYIIDESYERLDSVDVTYCRSVSVEEEQSLTVSVYPNPSTSIVNIELVENASNVNFTLYNVLGDKVMDRKLNSGNNTVNVTALPNGVYFYSILKDGVITETKKLVVRH